MCAVDISGDKTTIVIVDDDVKVRQKLETLLAGIGARVKTYCCAEALLREGVHADTRCMIAENCLPGMDGIQLMRTVQEQGIRMPTILLARFSDVPTAVRAMQAGAVDFIDKPFVDRVLLARVRQVLSNIKWLYPISRGNPNI